MLNERIALVYSAFTATFKWTTDIKYARENDSRCLGRVASYFCTDAGGKKMEIIPRPSPYVTRDPGALRSASGYGPAPTTRSRFIFLLLFYFWKFQVVSLSCFTSDEIELRDYNRSDI